MSYYYGGGGHGAPVPYANGGGYAPVTAPFTGGQFVPSSLHVVAPVSNFRDDSFRAPPPALPQMNPMMASSDRHYNSQSGGGVPYGRGQEYTRYQDGPQYPDRGAAGISGSYPGDQVRSDAGYGGARHQSGIYDPVLDGQQSLNSGRFGGSGVRNDRYSGNKDHDRLQENMRQEQQMRQDFEMRKGRSPQRNRYSRRQEDQMYENQKKEEAKRKDAERRGGMDKDRSSREQDDKRKRLEELTRKEKELEEKEKQLKEEMKRKEEERRKREEEEWKKREEERRQREELKRQEEEKKRREEERRLREMEERKKREEERRRKEEEERRYREQQERARREEEIRRREEMVRQEEARLMELQRKEEELRFQEEEHMRRQQYLQRQAEEERRKEEQLVMSIKMREAELREREERIRRMEDSTKMQEIELMQREKEVKLNEVRRMRADVRSLTQHHVQQEAEPHPSWDWDGRRDHHHGSGRHSIGNAGYRPDRSSGPSHPRDLKRPHDARDLKTGKFSSSHTKFAKKDMDLRKSDKISSRSKNKEQPRKIIVKNGSDKTSVESAAASRQSAFKRLGGKVDIKSRLGGRSTSSRSATKGKEDSVGNKSKNKETVEEDKDLEAERREAVEREKQIKERLLKAEKKKEEEGANKNNENENENEKKNEEDLNNIVIKRRSTEVKSSSKSEKNTAAGDKSLTVVTPQNMVAKLAMKLKELPKPAVEPSPKTDKQKAEIKKKIKTKYSKDDIPEKILFLALANVSYDEDRANQLIRKLLSNEEKVPEIVNLEEDGDETLDYEAD